MRVAALLLALPLAACASDLESAPPVPKKEQVARHEPNGTVRSVPRGSGYHQVPIGHYAVDPDGRTVRLATIGGCCPRGYRATVNVVQSSTQVTLFERRSRRPVAAVGIPRCIRVKLPAELVGQSIRDGTTGRRLFSFPLRVFPLTRRVCPTAPLTG